MNIFLCLNHFLPGQVAGTEIYCLQLAKFIQQKGHQVTVLIPNYGERENLEYEHEEIRVIKFAEPSVVDRELIMRKRIPLGVRSFINILSKEKPDLLHFHSVGGSNGVGMPHVRAASELGIKLLFTFHIAGNTCSTGTLKYNNSLPCDGYADPVRCTACIYTSKRISGLKARGLLALAASFLKLGYNTRDWNNSAGTALGFPFMIKEMKSDLAEISRLGEAMITLTKWYKKVLLLNGVPAEKLFYIAQGLPREMKENENNKMNINLPLRIIYIGRIIEDKGLHLLTEAIQKCDATKASLSIYGAVAENLYYEKLREQTKGNDNIKWNGVIPPENIAAVISHHHFLCVPSIICEMSPLVIQEAFAVRIPVLASDVYGNAEQVKDGTNGWLFQQGQAGDLAKKIQNLIIEPIQILRIKENIDFVRSFEEVGREHEIIYQKILLVSQ